MRKKGRKRYFLDDDLLNSHAFNDFAIAKIVVCNFTVEYHNLFLIFYFSGKIFVHFEKVINTDDFKRKGSFGEMAKEKVKKVRNNGCVAAVICIMDLCIAVQLKTG